MLIAARPTPALLTRRGASDPVCVHRGPNVSSSSVKIHTAAAFALPGALRFLDGIPCDPNAELGRSHARLPVTHMRAGPAEGKWFYYARGCSDFAWNVGRTLLVRNRYHLVVALEQQLRGGSVADAVARASALLVQRFHKFSALAVGRARGSGHGYMQRYFQRPCSKLSGCQPTNVSFEGLVRDAASGMNAAYSLDDEKRLTGCHAKGEVLSRADGCFGACSDRAHALAYVLAGDGRALDTVNKHLLMQLCGTPLQLDTVQLAQQPQGNGGIRWFTEIWEVRSFCPPASVSEEFLYSWPNGSRCEPSEPAQWKRCMSCRGSQLQRACRSLHPESGTDTFVRYE
mgnify:CR=1 FL=1